MTVEMTYKCIVCGHIHDEKIEGEWENLSHFFSCVLIVALYSRRITFSDS